MVGCSLRAGLVLVFAVIGSAVLAPGAASHAQVVGPCGVPVSTHEVVEPPNVDMWNEPVDASGEHELILVAHHDGARFCYRYTLNGALQTVEPTIRVRRGEHFALRIVNDLRGQSVGEAVSSTAIPPCMPMRMPAPPVVHYVGYLNHVIDDRYFAPPPVDTNFHLHGFEGPASEENVFLSTLSTPMHACEFRITIPRTQPPGTYFYHPHSHGTADVEVGGGLSGAWIVEPDYPQLPRSAEHVVMLRYAIPNLLDNAFAPNEDAIGNAGNAYEASLRPAPSVAYDPFDPPPWPVTFPMSGGGVMLDASGCNGASAEPILTVDGAGTPAILSVPAGQTQLLRIVNGAPDSPKPLRLRDAAGHLLPFEVSGLDGVPVSGDMVHPLSHYIAMNELVLPPMARADVLLTLNAGQTVTLSSEHFCEGKDAFFQMHHDLLEIHGISADGAAVLNSSPIPIALTPAAELIAFARANPSRIHRRAITFTEYGFPKVGKIPAHAGYYITDTTNPHFHEHPFWPVYAPGATVPSNADIVVRQRTIEEWYLINATMEAHAFHIHQMAFVEEKGPEGIPITVDEVYVPVGRLLPNRRNPNFPLIRPSITRILLDFRHVPKGTFPFHCHMLFHEDNGMMAVIRVE